MANFNDYTCELYQKAKEKRGREYTNVDLYEEAKNNKYLEEDEYEMAKQHHFDD